MNKILIFDSLPTRNISAKLGFRKIIFYKWMMVIKLHLKIRMYNYLLSINVSLI